MYLIFFPHSSYTIIQILLIGVWFPFCSSIGGFAFEDIEKKRALWSYIGLDLFRDNYDPAENFMVVLTCAIYQNLTFLICFFLDIFKLGNDFWIGYGLFPMISFLLFSKAIGQAVGIMYQQAKIDPEDGWLQYTLLTFCLLAYLSTISSILLIFYNYFAFE